MYNEVSDFMTGISDIYDYISKPCSKERMGFFDNIIKLYFGNESIKILDMSSNTGETSIELSNFGHNVLGIDFSEGMVKFATQKAKLKDNNAKFKLLNMKEIHLLESSYDLIFNNSLIWIPEIEDMRIIIEAMIDKVNNDGIIIVDIPNSEVFLRKCKSMYYNYSNIDNGVIYKLVRYYRKENFLEEELMLSQTYLKLDYIKNNEEVYSCDFKIRLHSKEEIKNILQSCNFIVENIYGDYNIDDKKKYGNLQIVTRKNC